MPELPPSRSLNKNGCSWPPLISSAHQEVTPRIPAEASDTAQLCRREADPTEVGDRCRELLLLSSKGQAVCATGEERPAATTSSSCQNAR